MVGVTPSIIWTASGGADLWAPVAAKMSLIVGKDLANRLVSDGFARRALLPGCGLSDAQAELKVLAKQLQEAYPGKKKRNRAEVLVHSNFLAGIERRCGVSGGRHSAVALFVSLAPMSRASWLGGRCSTQRDRVRLALGAGRWRLFATLATEEYVARPFGRSDGWPLGGWILTCDSANCIRAALVLRHHRARAYSDLSPFCGPPFWFPAERELLRLSPAAAGIEGRT